MTTKGQGKVRSSLSMACTVPPMLSGHIERCVFDIKRELVGGGAPMETGWSLWLGRTAQMEQGHDLNFERHMAKKTTLAR